MGLLIKQLEQAVQQNPNKTALVFNDSTVTYGKLDEAIKRFASALSKLGIKPGDSVALMMPNLPHFVVCYYGIIHLGATVVPLNVMHKKGQVIYALEDSASKAIIGWAGLQHIVLPAAKESTNCKTIILLGQKIPIGTYSLAKLISSAEPLEEGDAGEGISVINYTAGISDMPLGAEMTQEAIASSAATCQELFLVTGKDRVLAALPLFHPLGQSLMMHATLMSGATTFLMPRYSITELVEALKRYEITLLPGVPGIFKSLLELDASIEFSALKYCVSYGGRFEEETIEAFEQRFRCKMFKAYGLTEAGAVISANRINLERKQNAVGLPVIGTDIEIRTPTGGVAAVNQVGEIWVSGPTVMRGYRNKPAETAKKLQNGWLFTGDVGYLDEDHILFVLERKEDIIEKDGFQILPREIEDVIAKHEAVSEVAIVGIPDYAHGTEVKAFIVPKEGHTLTRHDVFQFCRQELPLYKCPHLIEFCDMIPKSPTGRVLKRELRNRGIGGKAAAIR